MILFRRLPSHTSCTDVNNHVPLPIYPLEREAKLFGCIDEGQLIWRCSVVGAFFGVNYDCVAEGEMQDYFAKA